MRFIEMWGKGVYPLVRGTRARNEPLAINSRGRGARAKNQKPKTQVKPTEELFIELIDWI